MGSSYYNSGGIVVGVAEIFEHPEFNQAVFLDYDFAIMKLKKCITFNAFRQPISLPDPKEELPVGAVLKVSGWGATNNPAETQSQLRQASVNLIDKTMCKSAYAENPPTDSMICAGVTTGGRDACQGDSGGPLVQANDLVGVVSWGYGCASAKYPGVYSKVSMVVPWINAIVSS